MIVENKQRKAKVVHAYNKTRLFDAKANAPPEDLKPLSNVRKSHEANLQNAGESKKALSKLSKTAGSKTPLSSSKNL